MALIEKHVKDPKATRPNVQMTNLIEELLPFYEARAQPSVWELDRPTLLDLHKQIHPILNDESMSDSNSMPNNNSTAEDRMMLLDFKCIRIFRTVDDWYGGKGWALLWKPRTPMTLG
jgi:hypothetical protein